jgi:hypothetical protein
MRKGCGCYGYVLAILAGLALGLGGLLFAGYMWASSKVLDKDPVVFRIKDWSAQDEAALALKIAPVARAVEKQEEKNFSLTFTPPEANRLFQEFLIRGHKDLSGEIVCGDTAFIVKFSDRVELSRYINGELRADVSGSGGKFTVKAHSLKAGHFDLPKPFLGELGHWIEGTLATQKLLQNEPWRLQGVTRSKNSINVEIKTVPKK